MLTAARHCNLNQTFQWVCKIFLSLWLESVICYCRHVLAGNTQPCFEGFAKNLGPNSKGLTILHLWDIDTLILKEWGKKDYKMAKKDWDVGTDSGKCGTLKVTLSRFQATPWKRIQWLSVHSPPPQDHVPKCRMGDTFFVKQLVNHQMCLHLQSETLAVGEMTALGGENPQDSHMKKESLECQMAWESCVLHFNLLPGMMLRLCCTSWFATDLGHEWKTSLVWWVSACRPTRHPTIPLCSGGHVIRPSVNRGKEKMMPSQTPETGWDLVGWASFSTAAPPTHNVVRV